MSNLNRIKNSITQLRELGMSYEEIELFWLKIIWSNANVKKPLLTLRLSLKIIRLEALLIIRKTFSS